MPRMERGEFDLIAVPQWSAKVGLDDHQARRRPMPLRISHANYGCQRNGLGADAGAKRRGRIALSLHGPGYS